MTYQEANALVDIPIVLMKTVSIIFALIVVQKWTR